MKVMSSVLEAIGNTPLVELSRITRTLPGRILLKLDYLNPGFSKKDRAALRIIEEAERSGALQPGQPVVELTSGNMGTGLAIVCAVKGYPFIIHPFPNGNGRFSRVMADLLLAEHDREPFAWGDTDLTAVGEIRDQYISALRQADGHNYAPLFEFLHV